MYARLLPVAAHFLLAAVVPVAAADTSPPLTVRNGAIIDAEGRQMLLRGVNLGEKSGARGHESWHGPQEFQDLHDWGMNCVRLLIFWSAIEPEPGKYDEAYLRTVDKRIAWARDAGLYVILDMHQDLYGPAIPGGDGAPPWATLHGNRPHNSLRGNWASAYLLSQKVHAAFDNLYANAPAPDGIGLQDHFAAAWAHAAARYADNSTVIGFDLLNEPFAGTLFIEAAWDVFRAVPQIFRGIDMRPGGEAPSPGAPPYWFLNALDEPARHRAFVNAFADTQRQFETTQLYPLYQRIVNAIRKVHPAGIIFLEPGAFANFGVVSHLPLVTGPDGAPDPYLAWYPHAYDIVTDTAAACNPSANRLDLIMKHHAEYAEAHNLPLLIGEWGALYGRSDCAHAAEIAVEDFERHNAGGFYWDYERGLGEKAYAHMLQRNVPRAVAGRLQAFRLDPRSGVFTCVWEEDPAVTADTLIYVNRRWFSATHTVTLEPPGAGYRFEPFPDKKDTGLLYIAPFEEPGIRRLKIAPGK
jgi:endoglycosylceramidase